jgi:hypothetical protein
MSVNHLTDKKVAKHFNISDRNLRQTYKSPQPTKSKPIITTKELEAKQKQYEVLRLGATCKEYALTEGKLLEAIEVLYNLKYR